MRISDATNIGIPKIIEPILRVGNEGISTNDDILSELDDNHALLVDTGIHAQQFLLDNDLTTVGREEKADIFLDDASVSRRHAEFIRIGRDFYVLDVGSLNGTYVNRELQESKYLLKFGDEVQIGRFRFTFLQSKKRAN
jgi:pSer/pThr/pTyr-binding forkhead associated (FHA) protein